MNFCCLRRAAPLALLAFLLWTGGNRFAHAQTTLLATADGDYLVPSGAWKTGAGWLPQGPPTEALFKTTGQSVVLFDVTGSPLGSAALGKWEPAEGEAPFTVKLNNSTLPSKTKNKTVLALNGEAAAWQTGLPPVTTTSISADEKKAVAQFLRQKGLPRAVAVHVTQIFHVDLDNDGQTETLVTSTSPKNNAMGAAALFYRNWYSVVMLLTRQNGVVRVLPIKSKIILRGSESDAVHYSLLGFPDLYHTKKREIVVQAEYYEGGGVFVYGWNKGKVTHDLGRGE